MKRTILLLAALLAAAGAAAQEAGRIFRTEAVPYDLRRDAERGDRAKSGHTIDFSPGMVSASDRSFVVGQRVDIPYVWTDGVVGLHLENVRSAYTLRVNDCEVARVEDPSTPAEFDLTECIRQGTNDIRLELRDSGAERINTAPTTREAFSGSYLYYQNKRSIRDFEIALVADTAGRRFGMLDLKIIARNAFNYDESVTVGFDIYSPQGKLLEFNMKEVTIPGRSTDTVRFSPYIYGTYDNVWSADRRNPPLYRVMLFTRRDGAYKEYMPLRIGFGRAELVDGRLMRLGRELQLSTPPATPRSIARRRAASCWRSRWPERTPSAPTVRSRPGSTSSATRWGSTSSTGPTSTPRTGARTAPWAAPPRTTPRWPTSTSSASRRCTTARVTSPASLPMPWAARRATATTCTRPTSG